MQARRILAPDQIGEDDRWEGRPLYEQEVFSRRGISLSRGELHLLQAKDLFNLSAEGGTRTRTAFWARGFSYHYSFRYPPLFSGLTVCGLDDAFSMHVSFFACLI